MTTASEVKARLLGQLEAFLAYLLPAGKAKGKEFRVGNVQGAPATKSGSLVVNIAAGDDRGAWKDFATGESGDVIDLYCAHKGLTFKDAFPELLRYLGMVDIKRPEPKPRPPAPSKEDVAGLSGTETLRYLEERGIKVETLRRYGVRSHRRQSQWNDHFICFQFWDSEGAPVMIKSTGINKKPEGGKDIFTTKPWYTLWGWPTVKPTDRELIITEGEIDAMSVYQMEPGMPVVSLPAGAANLEWIENDWTALQRFERFFLCFDNDDAGKIAAANVSKRLGLARCFQVSPPAKYKDANDALLSGDPEATEWTEWLTRVRSFDPPTLQGAKSFTEALKRRLERRKEDGLREFVLPSVKFTIRPGECTLVIGITGHGKSEFTYQMLCHEMRQGERVCICSFEIDPDEMLEHILTQLAGREINSSEVERYMAELDGKLWYFVPKEDQKREDWDAFLSDFDYAQKRFGCTRFLVDSLLFVTGKEDYDAQDQFGKRVRDFDRVRQTHTFVIAHCSTKKGPYAVPNLGDILGSSGIPSPFNNVVCVWRNHEKEDKLEDAVRRGDVGEANAINRSHDALFIVYKQRSTGKRSSTQLYFDTKSRLFRTTVDVPPPIGTTESLF